MKIFRLALLALSGVVLAGYGASAHPADHSALAAYTWFRHMISAPDHVAAIAAAAVIVALIGRSAALFLTRRRARAMKADK